MSLEGSLETLALSELLTLLADTSKSGEIRVSGVRSFGLLWVDAGQLTGFEVGRCDQAVDALFDLLRNERGDFQFHPGGPQPDSSLRIEPAHCVDIRLVLKQAEARLVEWADIVAVVPSLEHQVFLVPGAPDNGMDLRPAQWPMVVGIGEGRTVRQVLDRLGLPEFDGCKSIKELVEASLVAVTDPEISTDKDHAGTHGEADDTDAVIDQVRGDVDDAGLPGEMEHPLPFFTRYADPDTEVGEAEGGLAEEFAQDGQTDASNSGVDRGGWSPNELARLWGRVEDHLGDQNNECPGEKPVELAVGESVDDENGADHEAAEAINWQRLRKLLSPVRS